jgi:hypothetical protein
MMLNNVQILKAIDDCQQQAQGRPLWISVGGGHRLHVDPLRRRLPMPAGSAPWRC